VLALVTSCPGSERGKLNSNWPRSPVIVAKRLSGECTSARPIGSCVTLFITVPRRVSVCAAAEALLCPDKRIALLQQKRNMPTRNVVSKSEKCSKPRAGTGFEE
jgi:hypothetical protein